MGTPPTDLGDVASQHSDADDETTQDASDNQAAGGVAALFVTPTQPLLQQPAAQVAPAPQRDPTPTPAPRRRRRRTFDMSSVRRSARLSTTRPMTQMQRAQRNLCRKLGILNDEVAPIEIALQEFVDIFNGPLPVDVDAALNEIFNLNDNEVEALDNALIGIVGEGVDDLQDTIVHEPG